VRRHQARGGTTPSRAGSHPPSLPHPHTLKTQSSLFLNRKCKSLALQRKRAAKIAWTATYRKDHKKDQEANITRKKRRSAARAVVRPIAGVSVEVLAKRRAEKPEARKATREAAIREVKERSKAAKADKAAQRAAAAAAGKGKAGKAAPAPAKPAARGKR